MLETSTRFVATLVAALTIGLAACQDAAAQYDTLFAPWKRQPAPPGFRTWDRPHAGVATGVPTDEGAWAKLSASLPAHLRRQVVEYPTAESTGTIVVDTANTYLYFVLGNGRAVRYGIGVGREGFTWSGRERVSRKADWPDWRPPAEMIARNPELPDFVPGGLDSPLGARALYLGDTLYRIHGTNEPSSIGTFASSGCIRLLNADVIDLYQRVPIGAQVVVLASKSSKTRSGH